LIEASLKQRKGHFFKPQILVSQFATLEEPDAREQDVQAIYINQLLDSVVADIVAYVRGVASR